MAMQTQSVGDRHFIDAILYDQPVAPDFEDGLKVQAVIDAALESHRPSVLRILEQWLAKL